MHIRKTGVNQVDKNALIKFYAYTHTFSHKQIHFTLNKDITENKQKVDSLNNNKCLNLSINV